MIADKIIPSFYVVELEGAVINSIFADDFGIDKVVAASRQYNTDIIAIDAMMRCVDSLVSLSDGEYERALSFNPEFFPSLPPLQSPDEDEIAASMAVADAMTREYMEQGKVPLVLTQRFDPLGDYIEAKYVATADESRINAKVAVDPNIYMAFKAEEQAMRVDAIDRSTIGAVRIH